MRARVRACGAWVLGLSVTMGSGVALAQVPQPVRPILECVLANGDGSFTAFFGHLNQNPDPVSIAVGTDNRFTPLPQDRGQTTAFPAGRSPFYPAAAFAVVWDGASNLVWTLRGPDGSTRTSTASSTSTQQQCATKLPVGATCTLGGQCLSGACEAGLCTSACGNAITDAGEECDDGNVSDLDGCSASCTTEIAACGNGVVEGWAGEECDDGNTADGDACSAGCLPAAAPVPALGGGLPLGLGLLLALGGAAACSRSRHVRRGAARESSIVVAQSSRDLSDGEPATTVTLRPVDGIADRI